MSNEYTEALDWNSSIENESEFELLPEGVYEFTVISMDRGRYAGSEKMSACPQANLTIEVRDPKSNIQGKVFDTLYLHKKAEWRLSQFFIAIGQKKKGEPLQPNWNMVPGSTGKLELTINEYERNGEKKKNNRVARYVPREFKAFNGGF